VRFALITGMRAFVVLLNNRPSVRERGVVTGHRWCMPASKAKQI